MIVPINKYYGVDLHNTKFIEKFNITLYRINALKHFTLPDGTSVESGECGGWLSKSILMNYIYGH